MQNIRLLNTVDRLTSSLERQEVAKSRGELKEQSPLGAIFQELSGVKTTKFIPEKALRFKEIERSSLEKEIRAGIRRAAIKGNTKEVQRLIREIKKLGQPPIP